MSTDIVELKPCPFCGGEVGLGEIWQASNNNRQFYCWRFSCKNETCGIKAGTYIKDKDQAIAAWNRRVAEGGMSK
ncbi:MAG: hypothetical protein Pg6C_18050 [Treponemataceae bacterium]|nr:MAG: hypothetical protein Pg6C_18050 [Treponemataceae bacterium]